MEIFDKARELGLAVVNSEVYQNLKKAEAQQETDPEAIQLLKGYSDLRLELGKEIQAGTPTAERMEEIRTILNDEYKKVTENPVVAQFILAKNELEAVLNQMNTILSYYINGEQEGGCGGDCSGCSGCH